MEKKNQEPRVKNQDFTLITDFFIPYSYFALLFNFLAESYLSFLLALDS